MPAHLDDPMPSSPVDPLCFGVRGWLWLDVAQDQVAAIEAWSGDTLVGETSVLFVRPDVSVALNLPASASTGFELFAHHPAATPGESFAMRVSARHRDGSRTALDSATVATIPRDYRTNHFGILLHQRTTGIQ